MPLLSNILPIRKALGTTLRDALDRSRASVNEQEVQVVRLENKGVNISQVSVVEQFDWLNNSARQALSADELAERLHYLNFRPVLEQGIPQAFEGILEYRYFPQRGE